MREENKYLLEETKGHLAKSDYVFLTDFDRVTVADVAELRKNLADQKAEFHVVKNSIFKIAASERSMPNVGELSGPTAIVTGGNDPSEIAKVLIKFHESKNEKAEVKLGVMGDKVMTRDEVIELSKLPSLEFLRAQLLSLLSLPAQQFVTIAEAVPKAMLNVLQAKSREG